MGHSTIKRPSVAVLIVLGLLLVTPHPAEADVIRGLGKVISGVLQLPLSTLAGTFSGPPIVGTLLGAINGTIQGIGLVASGALDLAASGISMAKMVGPYLIPIFL